MQLEPVLNCGIIYSVTTISDLWACLIQLQLALIYGLV